MEMLRLHLLGGPQYFLGQRPLTDFATMKARALLIYLAMMPGPHSRDELAHLLWSEMPDRQAKKISAIRCPTSKRWSGRIS